MSSITNIEIDTSTPNNVDILIIEEILKEFSKLYQGFQLAIDLTYLKYTLRYYSPDNDTCYSDPDIIFANIKIIAQKFSKNTIVWIKYPTNKIKHILE